MKAAIIGAGQEALHTIKIAKEYQLPVIALDGNDKAEGLKIADEARVVDISNETETIECLRSEKIDFVLTAPIGRYLTTIGSVNDALALPGIGKEQAKYCTDKWLFHTKLAEQGLRKCFCYEVAASNDAQEQLYRQLCTKEKRLCFPAILKPRYGSGSRGIQIVKDLAELEEGLKSIAGESYVLEECAEGEEYGLDGAVINGKFYLILLRHKQNTPLPERQAVAYFSVMPQDTFYVEVREFMEKVISTLKLQECLLHADLIKQNQKPFIIELSARPSGHNLHNVFTPFCTGVDVAEQYIRYRMGMEYSFVAQTTKSMMIHYFDMEGRAVSVPERLEIEEALNITFKDFQCNIKEGDVLGPVHDGHSLMGRGYFVLEGESEEVLRKMAENVKTLFVMQKET